MIKIMDKVLGFGMLFTAIFTAWAVLTAHHLYIG